MVTRNTTWRTDTHTQANIGAHVFFLFKKDRISLSLILYSFCSPPQDEIHKNMCKLEQQIIEMENFASHLEEVFITVEVRPSVVISPQVASFKQLLPVSYRSHVLECESPPLPSAIH